MSIHFFRYGYMLPNTGAVVHWWREDMAGGLLNPVPVDMYALSYPGSGDVFPTVYFCGKWYSTWDHAQLMEAFERRAKGNPWGTIITSTDTLAMTDVIDKMNTPGWARGVLEYMDPEIREDLIYVHGLNRSEAIVMSYLGMYGNLEID